MNEKEKTELEETQEEIHQLGLDDGEEHATKIVPDIILKVAVVILTLSLLFGIAALLF